MITEVKLSNLPAGPVPSEGEACCAQLPGAEGGEAGQPPVEAAEAEWAGAAFGGRTGWAGGSSG